MGLSLQGLQNIKKKKLYLIASFIAVFALVAQPMYGLVASKIAEAASHGDVIVRQSSDQGWKQANIASGGTTSFVVDATAPYGQGALQLTTTSSTASKAQRTKSISPNVKLSDISELSYYTKQVTASNAAHAPSLQLTVNGLNGTSSNTILVFEPYWNTAGAPGVSKNLPNGAWQQWNVKDGVFWSTQTRATAGLVNGAGGPPFYTLATVIGNNPNAKVTSIAVNIGTYNASHVGLADGVNLNGTVYDFEPAVAPPVAPIITSPSPDGANITTANGEVTIEWGAVTGAEYYEVAINGNAPSPVIGGGTSFTTTLPAGDYSVTVRSVGPSNLYGGTSQARTFSVIVSQSPTNLNVKETVSGNTVAHLGYTNKDKLTASWTAPASGADSYIYTYWNDVTTSSHTAANPWTSPMSATSYAGTVNQGEGVHHWAVRSVKNGLQSDLSTTYTYTYDKTRPQVELLAPVAMNPTTYSVKGIDNFALKTVTAHIYNATNTTLVKNCSATATPAETNEYTLNCNVPALADGEYTIRYNALDMAGNISETKTSKFVIDGTAPTININNAFGGDAANKVFREVSFGYYDKNKVAYAQFNNDKIHDFGDAIWSNTDTVWANRGWTGVSEGLNTVDVYDVAGNKTTMQFTIDRTGPKVGLVAPAGATKANSVEVKGWATDEHMRYYACYITTNQPITAFGATWATGAEPKDGATNQDSLADPDCVTKWTSVDVGSSTSPVALGNFDISGLPDGSYTIHMHAHDLAGNQNEATTTFTIDRTEPAIPTATLKDWNNKSISNNGYITTKDFTFSLDNPSEDGVSKYQLKYCNDIAGSQFNCAANSWNLDNIAGSGYTTSPADIHKYVDKFSQEEGVHHFKFSACDAAGNCSQYSPKFTITYDKTAPDIKLGNEIVTVDNTPYYKDARKVAIKIEDRNIGETRIFKKDNDTQVLSNKSFIDSEFLLENGLPEGEYYAVHTDKAGNQSPKAYFVIANTKPTIENIVGKDIVSQHVDPSKTITFEVKTNNGTEIEYLEYKINKYNASNTSDNNRGDQVFSAVISTTDQTIDLSGDALTKLVDGERYVLRIGARNVAQVHGYGYKEFTVDNTAPELDITSIDVDKSNKTATINGTTTDGDSAVIVKIDGKEYTIDPSDFKKDGEVYKWTVTTDPLNIEKYTATANSRDEAGNEADEVESEEFEIKPPAFTSDGSGNSTAGAPSQNQQPSGIGPAPQSIPTPARRQIAQLTTPVVNDDSTTDNESISSSTKSTAKRQSAKSTDGENGEVLAAGNTNQNWSIVNLLLTIAIGVISVLSLAGAFVKNAKNKGARIATIIPAAGAVVTLLLVENFSGSMNIVNLWTILLGALTIVQLVILGRTRAKTE